MEPHHIDKIFQEKLKDFEATPKNDIWAKLEVALDEQTPSTVEKPKRTWRLLGLLLLCSVALWWGATYLYLQQKETTQNTSEQTEQFAEKQEKITQKQEDEAINTKDKKNEENFVNDATLPIESASTIKTTNININKVERLQTENNTLKEKTTTKTKVNETVTSKDSLATDVVTEKENTIVMPSTIKVKVTIRSQTPEGTEGIAEKDSSRTRIGKLFNKIKKIKNGEEKLNLKVLEQVGQ